MKVVPNFLTYDVYTAPLPSKEQRNYLGIMSAYSVPDSKDSWRLLGSVTGSVGVR